MPGQNRDELLTKTERDRLINRENMEDKKTRAANDVRVKKKLEAWLKNVPDVLSILKYLPEDQKRTVINDMDIFALLEVTENMLSIKEFHSIYGDFPDQANWGITDTCGDSRHYRVDPKSLKKTSDLDILRSLFLSDHLEKLHGFLGCNNPVEQFALTKQLEAKPGFQEYVTEGVRAGLDRVQQALKNIPDYLAQQRPNPKKIDLNYMVDIEQPKK
jgi:hypothetical protein